MAKDNGNWILIKNKNIVYRLIYYKLESFDGSFYINFVRKGKAEKKWTYKIDSENRINELTQIDEEIRKGADVSYHSSGYINYKNVHSMPIFGEPIFNITKPLTFIIYSIPSIKKLDIYQDILSENDFVLVLDDIFLDRINFECIIAPWNYIIKNELPVISIRYNNLFSLNILLRINNLQIPDDLMNCFNFACPSEGVYKRPVCDKGEAILYFHQKIMNSNDIIIYSPNSLGIYRMIFAAPMVIPPKINIAFEEKDYWAEVLNISKTNARFRVKDKYGQTIKRESKIKEIILNAEL
jgi:hypothetical protein